MTTSNHKPYTYPSGKIDIPSGTGRDGAVNIPIVPLSDNKKQAFYQLNKEDNSLVAIPIQKSFLYEAVSWYQAADYLFNHQLLKE